VAYYGSDEGWVVTNATFTSSAKALAQKSHVKLINGKMLKEGHLA
jgi:HJR/Mrr/RecB family endonuclease